MDILLFNPAPRRGFQAHRRIELPLSLISPATPLDRLGYKVKIIDQFANPDWETELNQALEHKPICMGVTSMTGPQILRALEASEAMKRRHPEVPVVWGGIHASLMPHQTLSNPNIDIIVSGEGEETFTELVQALQAGTELSQVQGIYYKAGDEIEATPRREFVDLDSQPPLAYHLVDVDRYRRNLFGVDHLTFNSSRGCTFACKFCWDPVIHRRSWRAMEPGTVMDQLQRIIKDYGIRGFLFSDDHFFINMKRARGIIEEIVRADLGIVISKLQLRADTVCRMDTEFLDLMVRAGVKRFTIGVESGSQRVLDLIKKDVTVEQVLEANRKLAPYPIVPLYLFMMGMPTETPDELRQSIELADRLIEDNPKAGKTFNIYTPFPGTDLYQYAVENGLRPPQRLEDWASFNFRNVQKDSPWIHPQTKRLIENLDLPLMFLGRNFTDPIRRTNPIIVSLAKLYQPIAQYRVRNMNVTFPIESKLVKAFGLFGRQG